MRGRRLSTERSGRKIPEDLARLGVLTTAPFAQHSRIRSVDTIDISIVTGTYNRIDYLKRMVTSTRRSVGTLRYEIVVVDGGSTDGTIEWLQEQEDIFPICQGELLGAVNAFNAGAEYSRGKYVILANDDIEFVEDSVFQSFLYMEQTPAVGVGCFQQDRDNREFHVNFMPVIYQDRQVLMAYGQVAICPKWLGDYVGWWGDYLHTYGGDNELSCRILELGFYTQELPCSCIRDLKADDKLRELNGGDPKYQKGEHPDSRAWRIKWTSPSGVFGPIVGSKPKPAIPPEAEPNVLRILYAPIMEPGNVKQRQTKTGLLDALQKRGVVVQYDYLSGTREGLIDALSELRPHLAILQAQNVGFFDSQFMKALRESFPWTYFVSWNGDYHLENLYDEAYMRTMREFHLATFVTADIQERYEAAGIPYRYWQIGIEFPKNEDLYHPGHDVVFMGNCYSTAREYLGKFLANLPYDVGLYGSWPKGLSVGETLYDFSMGHAIYRNSKIAISDQQWPHATGYVSNRLFQALASGVCVLQQRFVGAEEYLGLKEWKNVVFWDTMDDIAREVEFLLKNNEIRQRVAGAGKRLAHENHTFDSRVDELFEMIRNG